MLIDNKVAEKYPNIKLMADYFLKSGSEFERVFEDHLKIVEAEPNIITFEFKVTDRHVNRYGNLHGGLVATLIDLCSSFAIYVSTEAQWSDMGVSTDMAVSYMRGSPAGTVLKIVAEASRVGNRLATLNTRIYNEKGALCYSGSHTKLRVGSKL
ncbi:HotDog domain-containing protein [Sporodiniella umbellata]|nr:HotDog domain-containing protein [Sporodiniella umbellata]